MNPRVKAAARAAVDVLLSPQARRYEIALALLVYQAVRVAVGHA
jgi:hypothetical protein